MAEVELVKVKYTGKRSGNEYAVVPTVGAVKKGQEFWAAKSDAESWAVEHPGLDGEYIADYTLGDTWKGTLEEADEKRSKQQERSMGLSRELNATSGVRDAHLTDPAGGTVEEYAEAIDLGRRESIQRSVSISKRQGAAQTPAEATGEAVDAGTSAATSRTSGSGASDPVGHPAANPGTGSGSGASASSGGPAGHPAANPGTGTSRGASTSSMSTTSTGTTGSTGSTGGEAV